MPFVKDARGVAGIGLILGWGSRVVGGRAVFGHGRPVRRPLEASSRWGSVPGALVTENAGLLAVFVGSIASLWSVALLAHLEALPRRAQRAVPPGPSPPGMGDGAFDSGVRDA